MKKTSTLIFILLLFNCNIFAQYVWVQKTSLPGVSRYIASSFTIGSKTYIGSGYNVSAVAISDWWEYDEQTDVWTQKASSTTRSSSTSFVINGKGYVCLGLSGNTFLTDLKEYDPALNTWTTKASLPGQGRFGAAGFSIGSVGYVVCGNFGSATGPFTSQTYAYDANTNTWSAKAAFPGASRYGCRGQAIGTKGYVSAGTNGSASSAFFADLWVYNSTNNTWQQKVDFPGLPRQYPATFVISGKFVIGTGIHPSGYLNDFYAFDPVTDTWSTLPSLPAIEARWAAVGFSNGTDGFIATGNHSFNNPIIVTNDLWKLANTTGISSIAGNGNDVIESKVFPNPFAHEGTLQFKIKNAGSLATVSLYNISGQKVATLFSNQVTPGVDYSVKINSNSELNKGIYFYSIETENEVQSGKFMVIE